MKEIKTTRGKTILVDDEDADFVARYNWHAVKTTDGNRFYAAARNRGAGSRAARLLMHRLIMQPPPNMVVHHINNNGLDNRRANLIVATQRFNIRAACRTSGGVHIHKQTGRWRAQTRNASGKIVSLGLFPDKAAALAAVEFYRSKNADWAI